MMYLSRSFIKAFSSRTGGKWYFAVLPVALLFFLVSKSLLLIPFSMMLAAAFVSRLNDAGWSRWHGIWLMIWAFLAKGVLLAPLSAELSHHDKAQAFALIGWPFLIVASLLAFIPGQRTTNKFGPKPIGWREFWQARSANKAFLKAHSRSKSMIDELLMQLKGAQGAISTLTGEYTFDLKRLGFQGAETKRKELDAARTKFHEVLERVTAAQASLKPAMDATAVNDGRLSEILAYKARA